jgi:hypothetical protein
VSHRDATQRVTRTIAPRRSWADPGRPRPGALHRRPTDDASGAARADTTVSAEPVAARGRLPDGHDGRRRRIPIPGSLPESGVSRPRWAGTASSFAAGARGVRLRLQGRCGGPLRASRSMSWLTTAVPWPCRDPLEAPGRGRRRRSTSSMGVRSRADAPRARRASRSR